MGTKHHALKSLVLTIPFLIACSSYRVEQMGDGCFAYLASFDSHNVNSTFFYTGLTHTTTEFCQGTCRSYAQLLTANTTTRLYHAVFLSGLCFCDIIHGPQKSITGVSPTKVTCPRDVHCNSLEKTCKLAGTDTSGDLELETYVLTPDTVYTDSPMNVAVLSQLQLDELSVDFGDGTHARVDAGKQDIDHTYRFAGTYILRIMYRHIGYVIKTSFVSVYKRPDMKSLMLDAPAFLRFQKNAPAANDLYLYAIAGSNMAIEIVQDFVGGDGSRRVEREEIFTDVFAFHNGDSIWRSEVVLTGMPDEPSIIIPSSIPFKESGLITVLEVNVKSKGILVLHTLTPVYSGQGTLNPNDNDCMFCSEQHLSLLLNTSAVNGVSANLMANQTIFNVTSTAMLKLSHVDLQRHHINHFGLQIKKGDFLAVGQGCSGCAVLRYTTVIERNPGYAIIGDNSRGDSVGPCPLELKAKTPYLKAYLSKYTKVPIEGIYDQSGSLNITYRVMNSTNGTSTPNTTYQKYVVAELEFVDIVLGENSQKLNSINETLVIKAVVTPIPHEHSELTYNFRVNDTEFNMTTQNNNTAVFSYRNLTSGFYNVSVTVTNVIGTITNTSEIRVLQKIANLTVHNVTKYWTMDQPYTVDVEIIEGTGIELYIDFGENATLGKNVSYNYIDDANVGTQGRQVVKYKYDTCGIFNVKVRAGNAIRELTRNFTTYVMCKVADITVDGPAKNSKAGVFEISFLQELKLDVAVKSGSNVTYKIYWGDSKEETIVQVEKFHPESVKFSHFYKTTEMYKVTVTVSNMVSKAIKKIDVNVSGCAIPPEVNFDYGTEDAPFELTVAEAGMKEFRASWMYESQYCVDKHASLYSAVGFEFFSIDRNEAIAINQNEVHRLLNTITIRLKNETRRAGLYKLTLTMKYSNKIHKHDVFLRITESPLEARMENGIFQTVPTKQKQSREASSDFYDFVFNARKSGDPDSPGDISHLTFTWTCQVIDGTVPSGNTFCNEAAPGWHTIQKGNCVKGDVKRFLNVTSKCLEPDVTYLFTLNVTSLGAFGLRSDAVSKKISVVDGDAPLLDFVCVKNCEYYVNQMERTMFEYTCKGCWDRTLIGNWTMSSNTTNSTNPAEFATSIELFINSGLLCSDTLYTFELTVRYEDSDTLMKYKVLLRTSSKPYYGECDVIPSQGKSLQTKFKVYCKNWISDHGPLQYDIRYDTGKKIAGTRGEKSFQSLPLLNPNSLSSPSAMNVMFPVGLKERDHVIQLIIHIKDKYGSHVEWKKSSVKVTPPVFNTTKPGGESVAGGKVSIKDIINGLSDMKPTNPNDTEAVTGYINSLSSILDGLDDHAGSDGDSSSKDGGKDGSGIADGNGGGAVGGGDGVIGGGVGDKSITASSEDFDGSAAAAKKEQEKEAARAKAEITKMRENMVGMLHKVPIGGINEAETISSSLGDVTKRPDEMSESAVDNAISIMLKIRDVLRKPGEKVGAARAEETNKANMNTLSNIILVAAKPVPGENVIKEETNSTKGEELSPVIKKKAANIKVLLSCIESGSDNILNGYIPDKSGIIHVSTPQFQLALSKFSMASLNHKVTLSQEGPDMKRNESKPKIALPVFSDDYLKSHGLDPQEEITIKSTNFETNIFTWDLKNSHKIKSQVNSFAINVGKDKRPMSTAIVPMLVTVKNKPELIVPRTIKLYMPGDIFFDNVEVDQNACTLILHFDFLNDLKHDTELTVYIQYGRFPSSSDYDVRLTLDPTTHSMNTSVMNTTYVIRSDSDVTPGGKRVVFFRKMEGRSLMMWNFANFEYANETNEENKTLLYVSYVYTGPMPPLKYQGNPYTFDIIELRGSFDYTFRSYCAKCSYWDAHREKWSSHGCKVDPWNTTFLETTCLCDKLHTMRMRRELVTSDQEGDKEESNVVPVGGLFVEPNKLKPLTLANFIHGFLLFLVVMTILLLYIIGLVIARRADRNDIQKIGVCPLADNNPNDKYLYLVTLNTGGHRDAGTTSNIYMSISGDVCDSNTHHMIDPERASFERNSSNVFIMATSNTLGALNYIRIWHDSKGGDWYLTTVEILDVQTDEKSIFIGSRWFACDHHSGRTDFVIPASGKDFDFNYLFSHKTNKDFTDRHIWFSIYARPPTSSFTRCQRLSVAMSLLFTSMVASCMFFRVDTTTAQTQNQVGGFSFTWPQIIAALISACVSVPINIILATLFKMIRPFPRFSDDLSDDLSGINDNGGFVTEATEITDMVDTVDQRDSDLEAGLYKGESGSGSEGELKSMGQQMPRKSIASTSMATKKKTKEPFYLPYWCIYPTWVLTVTVILVSGFFVIWYGISFGNKKSLDWLVSVTIAFLQDILLIQPIKIFCFAIVFACIIKKVDSHDSDKLHNEIKTLSKDEEWLHSMQPVQETNVDEEERLEAIKRRQGPDLAEIERYRQQRRKEARMSGIFNEIIGYCIYVAIVFFIGNNFRGHHAFNQIKDMKELLRLSIRDPETEMFSDVEIFQRLQSYQQFWDWTDKMLLNELYPSKWFDLSDEHLSQGKLNFPGKVFLNDLNSKVVNGVRMRQLRVRRGACELNEKDAKLVKIPCMDTYSHMSEDKGNYKLNWSQPMPSNHTPRLYPRSAPWIYQSASTLDSYTLMAKLEMYHGGGYVADFFPRFANRKLLSDLKQRQWIDRQTRAVMIEFVTYNAQTGYFANVLIVFEFPPFGGLVHYAAVDTFRLTMFTQETAFFTITCWILYLVFLAHFIHSELRQLYRNGPGYFHEFWNMLEMVIIILSVVAVFMFVYLGYLRRGLMSRLAVREYNVFINFQKAFIWYENLIQVVSLLTFFMIIKFLKLLRFNKHIAMLCTTLKSAWQPLGSFALMFLVVILAVVFSANIIFGNNLYGYRNVWGTFSAVFSLLLGKFSYQQFERTNRILGPIFFFAFNIIVNWIIMNMFISILNEAFAEVASSLVGQEDEYEMMEYMLKHLKFWFGIRDSPKPDTYADPSVEQQDIDKVDQSTTPSTLSMSSYYSFSQHRKSVCSQQSASEFPPELFTRYNPCLDPSDDEEDDDVGEMVGRFVKGLINFNSYASTA